MDRVLREEMERILRRASVGCYRNGETDKIMYGGGQLKEQHGLNKGGDSRSEG
jgi:hypothetical protein